MDGSSIGWDFLLILRNSGSCGSVVHPNLFQTAKLKIGEKYLHFFLLGVDFLADDTSHKTKLAILISNTPSA